MDREAVAREVVTRALSGLPLMSSHWSASDPLGKVVAGYPSSEMKDQACRAINVALRHAFPGEFVVELLPAALHETTTVAEVVVSVSGLIPPTLYKCPAGHYSLSGGACKIDGSPMSRA